MGSTPTLPAFANFPIVMSMGIDSVPQYGMYGLANGFTRQRRCEMLDRVQLAEKPKKAVLYRMVMPGHTCPYGLKARHLLGSVAIGRASWRGRVCQDV